MTDSRDEVLRGWSALKIEPVEEETEAQSRPMLIAPETADTGRPLFRRAPRDYFPPPAGEIEIQAPPQAPSPPTMSMVVLLLPLIGSLIVGGMAAGVSGNMTYALLMVPMMAVTSLGTMYQRSEERRKFRRDTDRREIAYRNYLDERKALLTATEEQQRRASLLPNPPLTECRARIERADRRLWERSPQDPDFLDLRLGMGSSPLLFSIRPPAEPQIAVETDHLLTEGRSLADAFTEVDGSAVTLPLARVGAAGLVGPRPAAQQALRTLLLGLATHHAPNDVKIILTYPESEHADWEWIRWLPHTWDDDRNQRFIASTPEAANAMLSGLGTNLRRRASQLQDGAKRIDEPALVFIFADPAMLAGSEAARFGPLLQLLLSQGTRIGAYAIMLANRPDAVHKGAGAIVELMGNSGRLRIIGPPPIESVFTPDTIDLATADQFARSFAPLRLPHIGGSTDLPAMVPLLELLGGQRVEDLPILAHWQRNEPYRTLTTPIGLLAGGDRLEIDIHERGHGPHGLAAGTTGSGKSELLQTLIASLAVSYHPHELAFVLIDYKGGGMANYFRDLPHTIGIITNLGGNLTRRALATLQSELRRRQRLFDQAGVNNIDDYLRRHRQGQTREPLPHVAIIADEFAELAQNQPEFMAELMSAVRVGRSLGIHLLLATQKPAGVVNDQITSNTRFRLCLRVVQREDSMEMLRRPDAAEIRQPGRGYFQVGINEVYELFQAAWGGVPYGEHVQDDQPSTEIMLVELDGTRRILLRSEDAVIPDHANRSQLEAIVSHIRDVSRGAGIFALPSFWLPPLAEFVALNDVRTASHGGWDGAGWQPVREWLAPVIGQVDDPNNQFQGPLRPNLGRDGHFYVVGAPGSGKTTLLQTMVMSLAQDHSPASVHIYLLDFGGRLLKLFEQLPHVGAVLLPDDEELIGRLFRMLASRLDNNKSLLADAGIGSFSAYRDHVGPENAPPATVLMIDNFNEFANAYPDLVDEVTRIAREGGNLGIHVVLTGSSAGAIPMRLASNFALAAALELTDASDYGSVVGRTNGLIPERGVRGRGLIRDTSPLEFQTCAPGSGQLESERLRAIRSFIAGMAGAWDGPVAPPVLRVPHLLPLNDLLPSSPLWTVDANSTLAVPIGVDVETLEPLEVDIRQDPHMIVTGSPLSGKTTLLQTWLVALAERYAPESLEMVIISMGSPLFMPFSRLPHLKSLVEDDDQLTECAEHLRTELSNRQEALDTARRAARGTLTDDEFIARFPTVLIAIDDLDQFFNLANESSKEILTNLVRRGRRLGFRFIVASPSRDLASSWDALAKALKEAQTGLLLGTSDHEDLAHFNLRVPPLEAGKSLPPGRGYSGKRGQFRRVQVASIHAGKPALIERIESISAKRRGAIEPS